MRDWARKNRESFERDVLRDFCRVAVLLQEQFGRFAATRALSYSILRGMIGEPLNKGLLWRLKDKAHHVFLRADPVRPPGLLLDWALGYIFHETMKLAEDAHQMQYYAPRLRNAALGKGGPRLEQLPGIGHLADVPRSILAETIESMRRETGHIALLLDYSRRLFCLYFAGEDRHRPLARFLNDNGDLAGRAFGQDFEPFLHAVYGRERERMHLEAARSLRESAREDDAARAMERALALNPDCAPDMPPAARNQPR